MRVRDICRALDKKTALTQHYGPDRNSNDLSSCDSSEKPFFPAHKRKGVSGVTNVRNGSFADRPLPKSAFPSQTSANGGKRTFAVYAVYTDCMLRLDALRKRLWRRFITPPAPANLWKRVSWGLWLTSPIMLFPLLLPVLEPASIPGLLASYWQVYLLFFGLPFALGAFCWRCGSRAGSLTSSSSAMGRKRTLDWRPPLIES